VQGDGIKFEAFAVVYNARAIGFADTYLGTLGVEMHDRCPHHDPIPRDQDLPHPRHLSRTVSPSNFTVVAEPRP
jgi:hypothetical protein